MKNRKLSAGLAIAMALTLTCTSSLTEKSFAASINRDETSSEDDGENLKMYQEKRDKKLAEIREKIMRAKNVQRSPLYKNSDPKQIQAFDGALAAAEAEVSNLPQKMSISEAEKKEDRFDRAIKDLDDKYNDLNGAIDYHDLKFAAAGYERTIMMDIYLSSSEEEKTRFNEAYKQAKIALKEAEDFNNNESNLPASQVQRDIDSALKNYNDAYYSLGSIAEAREHLKEKIKEAEALLGKSDIYNKKALADLQAAVSAGKVSAEAENPTIGELLKYTDEIDKAIKVIKPNNDQDLSGKLETALKTLKTKKEALAYIKKIAPDFVKRTQKTYNSLVKRVDDTIVKVQKAIDNLK